MEKLKSRLDAFSDAIIAIIITIMVLNIPPVIHDSLANYMQLGKSVGVYFISFIFVANMWYQHGTAFGEIDTMTYRIVILDMLFLAPLSLMPLLTNMMALNTTRITVILYGCLQLLVNVLFRMLAKAIIHLQYTEDTEMRKVYQKIYGNSNHILDILSIGALVVAFIQPEFSLFFYLAYPVFMFLLNSSARQEMFDVEALPEEQKRDFTSLNASGVREFRKAQREFANSNTATTTTTQKVGAASTAKTQNVSAPAGQPTTQQNQPDNSTDNFGLPANWSHWLDQNVDPKRQQQVRERFSRSSPEQQARMQQWFEQRRQSMAYRNQRAKNNQQRSAHHEKIKNKRD